jgi:predicted MFS family arabinose efflux permease
MKAFRDQFSTGYINPVNNEVELSPRQQAQVVAILSVGTFFGALLAAPLGDKLGRRLSLIITMGVFGSGVLVQTCSMHINLLTVGR